MYTLGDRYQDTNGYILVYEPSHPRAMKSGAFKGYVYEHILIAEEITDRSLSPGEEVHHLDFNKSNNSPDNLLVLSGPMHVKLHNWLDKYELVPTEKQKSREELGCVRCKNCSKPIHYEQVFCSVDCIRKNQEERRTAFRPSPDELSRMVWEKPTSQIANDYGVSDTAIAKWCKQEGISKPPRGYWMKKLSDK